MAKTPTERETRLVRALAKGLEGYWDERPGNIACHLQAAAILIKDGLLSDFETADFLTFTKYCGKRQETR